MLFSLKSLFSNQPPDEGRSDTSTDTEDDMADPKHDTIFVRTTTVEGTALPSLSTVPSHGTESAADSATLANFHNRGADERVSSSEEHLARRIIKTPSSHSRTSSNASANMDRNQSPQPGTGPQATLVRPAKHGQNSLPIHITENISNIKKRSSFKDQASNRSDCSEARTELSIIWDVIRWVVRISEVDLESENIINQSMRELQTKMEEDTQRLVSLKEEADTLLADGERKKDMIDLLNQELKKVKLADAATLDRAKVSLSGRIRFLENELKIARTQLEEKERDKARVHEKIKKRISDTLQNAALTKATCELEVRKRESNEVTLKQTIFELEMKCRQLSEHLSREQHENTTTKEDLKIAQDALKAGSQIVTSAEQKINEATRQIGEANRQTNEAYRQTNEAKTENRQLRAGLRGEQLLNARVTELEGEITHSKASITVLRNELHGVKGSKKELQSHLDDTLKDLSRVQLENATIEARLQDFVEQIAEMNASQTLDKEEIARLEKALQIAEASSTSKKADEQKFLVKKNEHTRQVLEQQLKANADRANRIKAHEQSLKILDEQIEELSIQIADGNMLLKQRAPAETSPENTTVTPSMLNIQSNGNRRGQKKSTAEEYPLLPSAAKPRGTPPSEPASMRDDQAGLSFANAAKKGGSTGVLKIVNPKGPPKGPRKAGQK